MTMASAMTTIIAKIVLRNSQVKSMGDCPNSATASAVPVGVGLGEGVGATVGDGLETAAGAGVAAAAGVKPHKKTPQLTGMINERKIFIQKF